MNHFFAYLSRMRYIERWGIMRNTQRENIMEHSMQVCMIAHNLCIIKNKKYNGSVDVEKVLLLGLYHETSEVITGDLATPIKYYNPEIAASYKKIEHIANEKILSMLPEYMQEDYSFIVDDEDKEAERIVKAADKICAYIKCLEELKMGNGEFAKAKETVLKSIKDMHMPEVDEWLETFAPSFELTLDELN